MCGTRSFFIKCFMITNWVGNQCCCHSTHNFKPVTCPPASLKLADMWWKDRMKKVMLMTNWVHVIVSWMCFTINSLSVSIEYLKLHRFTCCVCFVPVKYDTSVTLCFQDGSSPLFPPLHQCVQSVWNSCVFVQQCGGVSAATSLSGRHARWRVFILVHCPWVSCMNIQVSSHLSNR